MEQPRRVRSQGSPKAYALCPPAGRHNREHEGAVAASLVSSDDDNVLLCVRWDRAEGVFAPMLQDECNGLAKIVEAL